MANIVVDSRSRPSDVPMSTKYSPLPRISNDNSQLIPYLANQNDLKDAEDRVRLLETRLHITEKSNRAMLDEVIRIQNELKAVSRRNEDQLRDERVARQYLENSLRASNDLLAQLSSRLRGAEEQIAEERSAMNQTVSNGQIIEATLHGLQSESNQRRNLEQSKIAAMEINLDEMTRARHQLERIAFQLVDEVRIIKTHVYSQQAQLSNVSTDIRVKTKKIEDDYLHNVDDLRRKLDRKNETEFGVGTDAQLRQQFESRTNDLRELIVELRSAYASEQSERRELEVRFSQRATDLTHQLAEHGRKRDELAHTWETQLKDRQHHFDTDKLNLQSKLAETIEEIHSKLAEAEIKIREENFRRNNELERLVRAEQDARALHEREQRQEAEKRWETQRRLHEQEATALKEHHRIDRKKYSESMRRMDDAITLVERQIQEINKDTHRVLTAEIKSRKQKEKENRSRFHEVEEKISAVTMAMQQAIGGVATNVDKLSNSNSKNVHLILEEHRNELHRYMSDIDARVLALQSRVSGIDDRVEAKISAASTAMAANIREKMESISMWQTATNASLAEQRTQKSALQEEIYRQHERLDLLKAEIQSRVGQELDGRLHDVESLRREIDATRDMIPKEDLAKKRELEQAQSSIRKLAESFQTVKTVLGMKIASENKMRVEEVKNLQDEIIKLRAVLEQFVHVKLQPRMFVKPKDTRHLMRSDVENSATPVNMWSIYTAYRWLSWKSRWMYVKWALSNRQRGALTSRATARSPPNEKSQNTERTKLPNSPLHPWDEEGESSKPASAERASPKRELDNAN